MYYMKTASASTDVSKQLYMRRVSASTGIYITTSVFVNVHIYVCIYERIYIHICAYTYIYVYMCIYIYTYIFIHIYIYLYMHIYIHAYMCTLTNALVVRIYLCQQRLFSYITVLIHLCQQKLISYNTIPTSMIDLNREHQTELLLLVQLSARLQVTHHLSPVRTKKINLSV